MSELKLNQSSIDYIHERNHSDYSCKDKTTTINNNILCSTKQFKNSKLFIKKEKN
jgi:hypothetical protein